MYICICRVASVYTNLILNELRVLNIYNTYKGVIRLWFNNEVLLLYKEGSDTAFTNNNCGGLK